VQGTYGNSTLNFRVGESFKRPYFIDFLHAGWQMSLFAAIDYTASNGEPSEESSLHYISKKKNPYEKALLNVGRVIESYSHEKSYPVFGFGGIPRHLKVS